MNRQSLRGSTTAMVVAGVSVLGFGLLFSWRAGPATTAAVVVSESAALVPARAPFIGELRGHHGGVSGVAWSPDGTLLASAGLDHVVRLWDAGQGAALAELKGHAHEVYAVAFAPDGQHLASTGYDGRVIVWDVDTRALVRTFEVPRWSVAIAFSPGGELLAAGCQDGTLLLWDWQSGEVRKRLALGEPVDALAFSNDGRRLATAFISIRIVDLAGDRPMKTLPGHQNIVTGLLFGPEDAELYSVSIDKSARAWDPVTGSTLRQLAPAPEAGSSPLPLSALAVRPDDGRVALGGASRGVHLVDGPTGGHPRKLGAHKKVVTGLAFAPDGRRVASSSMDGTVRIWQAQ